YTATRREHRLASIAAGAACGGIVVVILMTSGTILLHIETYFDFLRGNFIVAPLLAFIMIFMARYDSALSRVLSHRTLVRGGELSYSIYLVHPFVITMFILTAIPPLSATAEWTFRTATAMISAIVLAGGTFSLIEMPAKRWIRGLASRRHGR